MAKLSWNEIRHNAIAFAKSWPDAERENADKQTFWNEFFEVFGLKRRLIATFEEPVKKLSGRYGFIDLFWPRTLLIEHKTRGESLDAAHSQAFDYIRGLLRDGRGDEAPRYVLVSDFARLRLYDLEPDEQRDLPLFDRLGRLAVVADFPLAKFHEHIHAFAFIPGYQQHRYTEQAPINLAAVGLMAHLHDTLEAGGYSGHDLERFLVRVLFCLFAEDTGIFERDAFRLFLENRTAPDGSDLGDRLARLFEVLNTETHRRQRHLDEELAAFPYVNGALFAERLGFADFNRDMRNALLAATHFDWSGISPAVFGSLFQGVMEPRARRQLGAHYTSERDILKVVRSLFLDELRADFESARADKSRRRRARLEEFHERLVNLRFLDPACGCGNFLILTYRELRLLEIDVLKELKRGETEFTLDEVNRLSRVNVDQFHGIEIGEWPARIAEVALWLMDHQMNLRVSEAFGQLYQRLPLRATPHIVVGNALQEDWNVVLLRKQCSFVLGNPPFVGKKEQNAAQKADMTRVWGETRGAGILDFVSAWYRKAGEYIRLYRA